MALILIERLIEHAQRRGEAIALRQVETGQTWTWGQLESASRGVAARLAQDLPVGATVLLCAPNEPQFIAAFLGILRAGCKAYPLPPTSAPDELAAAIVDARVKAVISAALAGHDLKTILLDEVTEMADDQRAATVDREPAQSALLLNSSGTTGRPKIVHRSAASLNAVIDAMCTAIPFGLNDRVLGVVPLCHSYGIEHGLLAPISAGSRVDLCRQFDLPTLLAQLRTQTTIFPGVPFIFDALAKDEPARFPHLRFAYSAGGPLPWTVAEAFHIRCGVRIGQVYGATEIGSVTFSNPNASDFSPASVGKPMRDVTIKISEDTGEISVHAKSMFGGYLNNPSALGTTAYFSTGDSGRFDAAGNLTITGRLKLLIDIGGQKVNPLEVEQVLSEHPSVGDCIVVALPLSSTVTRLKALIAPRAGGPTPSPDALRRFAKSRLRPYKVPRIFEVRHFLPRSPAGKILRHLIED